MGSPWFEKMTVQELGRLHDWCKDLQGKIERDHDRVVILMFASGILGALAMAAAKAFIGKWVN